MFGSAELFKTTMRHLEPHLGPLEATVAFANNHYGCLVRLHNNMRVLHPRVQRPNHPQQFLKSENLIRPPITIFRWLYPSGTPHESNRCLDRPDPHGEAFVAALVNVTQARAYDSRRTTLPLLCFHQLDQ
jgi:hypothetical protein